jgi:hypothetical protein
VTPLETFLFEHRVVPGDTHPEAGFLESGHPDHDPLVRPFTKRYQAWCKEHEVWPKTEDEFVPAVIAAGFDKYKTEAGQRFRGLLLVPAVEHAQGEDPDTYWAAQADRRREERRMEREREDAARAAREEAERRRLAQDRVNHWWDRGAAYWYVLYGQALPAEVEAARAEQLDQARMDWYALGVIEREEETESGLRAVADLEGQPYIPPQKRTRRVWRGSPIDGAYVIEPEPTYFAWEAARLAQDANWRERARQRRASAPRGRSILDAMADQGED